MMLFFSKARSVFEAVCRGQIMFNLRDIRPNIVAKKFSSTTEVILQPTVWKGIRIRGRKWVC